MAGSKSENTHHPVEQVKVSLARYWSKRKCLGKSNILLTMIQY